MLIPRWLRGSRPVLLALVLLTILLNVPGCLSSFSGREKEVTCQRCNVVLVSVDALRADRLGAYGYGKNVSPAIDLLAGRSAVFEHAYSQASNTLPSHMSLLTSLYPSDHLVGSKALPEDSIPSPEALTLLPEVLASSGYAAYAYTGGANLHGSYGFSQGFEEYDDASGGLESFLGMEDPFGTLLAKAGGRPFFLFLHTYKVHDPYLPSRESRKAFCAGYNESIIDTHRELLKEAIALTVKSGDTQRQQAIFDGLMRTAGNGTALGRRLSLALDAESLPEALLEAGETIAGADEEEAKDSFFAAYGWEGLPLEYMRPLIFPAEPSEGEVRQLSCLYDTEIAEADRELQRLFSGLDAHALWNETVVIITSDHGEEFYEHRGFRHGRLFDEIVHVPLIVWMPGIGEQGRKVRQDAALIDVFPTLLDVLGIEGSPSVRGASLAPLLAGRDAPVHEAIFSELDGVTYAVRASLDGTAYKLIVEDASVMLFDLDADPAELDNIAAERPEAASALTAMIRAHLAEAAAFNDGRGVQRMPHDEERLAQLRSLGYLE